MYKKNVSDYQNCLTANRKTFCKACVKISTLKHKNSFTFENVSSCVLYN